MRSANKKILLFSLALPFCVATAATAGGLTDAFSNGKILFDARLRNEFVDQAGFDKNAEALTFRSRFGFETASYAGFTLLAEGDFTRDLGVNDFNSTTNGKVQYPIVADPNSDRLNRLRLSYTGPFGSQLTLGRQRILLDNNRFVGNVGFRQNEQTFDAVRLSTARIAGFKLDYSYLWQVNRIFGSRSSVGTSAADTHLINLSYRTPLGLLTTYAYLIDLANLPTASNQTYGVRFAGKTPGEAFNIRYAAEYATQKDYGPNPDDFSLDYYLLEAGAGVGPWSVKAAYEVLGGNGERGFTMPLATLHKFQGFADVFLTTPASGVRDLQVMADYTLRNTPFTGPVRFAAWYHDFSAEHGSGDLGREIDLGLFADLTKNVKLTLKFADYWGADTLASRRKAWMSIDFTY